MKTEIEKKSAPAAHTPLPWHVETWKYETRGNRLVIQTHTDAIAELLPLFRTTQGPEEAANAALIVTAVNERPAILARIAKLEAALSNMADVYHLLPVGAARVMAAKARAALKGAAK